MICDEEAHGLDSTEQHAEIVEEILAIEEVVRCHQKVPGQTAEPGKPVYAIHLVADRNNFLKALDLYSERLQLFG